MDPALQAVLAEYERRSEREWQVMKSLPQAEIAARIAEECIYELLAPVARVSGWDIHTPLYRLEMKQLPSTARIVDAAKRTLAAS